MRPACDLYSRAGRSFFMQTKMDHKNGGAKIATAVAAGPFKKRNWYWGYFSFGLLLKA